MQEKKLTLASTSGSRKILAILLVVILLCSFIAQLISTNCGKIKVSNITVDVRGAELCFDQYVPAGVSDSDSLPAIVTIHGGGCPSGVMRGIAEELAKRGFVVVNVNAYGAGLSEQPMSDDGGQGANGFNPFGGPQGVLDAVNYLRGLKFVDSQRIGVVGHSLGATRTSMAALADCSYLTLNDQLVNILSDTFGVEINEEEILMPADELAAKNLNVDQMAYYEALKAETEEHFNTRIKAITLLGSDAAQVYPQSIVTVAGNEVSRSLQTNIALINGLWDTGGRGEAQNLDAVKGGLYLSEAAMTDTWYALNDQEQNATALGGMFSISEDNDAALAQAIDQRSARIICVNEETHSKNFFSAQTAKDIVKVNEQMLGYNGGNLGQGNQPVAAEKSSSFIWRAIFNCVAMLAMIGLIFPVVALLVNCEFFRECVGTKTASTANAYNKATYWISAIAIVVYTFIAIYMGNNKGVMRFPINHTWPLAGTAGNTILFILILAGCSLVLLICYALIGKKTCGETGFSSLLGGVSVIGVLKCLLMAVITLVIGYATLMLISYLFNQDYRLWMTSFGEMRVELWFIAARYALMFAPMFLLMGAVTNYTVRNDIGEWKDTLINVVIGSLGVWLCCAVDLLLCKFGNYNGNHFAAFTCSYSMLLYVPITVVINRKLFNITKNIWTGTFVNAVFLAWSFTASQTLSDAYFGQNILSVFFGA